MNVILLILSVVLPLLPVIMFPTRFIGRGMPATVVGAGLLVGMMMLIYFGLSSVTGVQGTDAQAATSLPTLSDADERVLADLLR